MLIRSEDTMPINFSPKGGPSAPHAPAPDAKQHTVHMGSKPQESYGTKLAARMAAAKNAPPQPSGLVDAPKESIGENSPKAPEAPSQPLSPQYAALARQTAALRKAQQDLKKEQEAWKARESEYVPKARLRDNTLDALAEADISYDRLVELQLDRAGQSAKDPIHTELDALRKELADLRTAGETASTNSYQAALKQIERDANLLVDSDPAYEVTKATNNTKEVVNLIEAVFKEEGIVLTVEEAASEVEKQLLETSTQSVRQLSQLAKIKAQLEAKAEANAPSPSPLSDQGASAPQGLAQARPTLTNNLGSTRPLSARERAVLAFEGRLNNK